MLLVLRLLVSNQTDLSKVPFAIPGQVQVTTRVDIIGQRAITPNFFRTYKTLIFSCLDNDTLCIVLSKLIHIIAHPPARSTGGGERGRPPGRLQQQPYAIFRNPESSFSPSSNVELSTPASNNGIWLILRTHYVPPLPPLQYP